MVTFTNFMNDWASIARSSGGGVPRPAVCPRFDAANLFPPDFDVGSEASGGGDSGIERVEENVCCRRLVFEGSKIAALRAMVSEKVENPTRVQMLTGLIYKAAISAKYSVSGGLSTQPTCILQIINLRSRVQPQLPVTLVGNIVSLFLASSTPPKEMRETTELWRFVADVKRNFEEFCRKFPKNYRAKEWASLHKSYTKESMERWRNRGDHALYTCSSWCRFPLYDADFGSGKPIWIGAPRFLLKNMILLMDVEDGQGIEVMVSLVKEEMEVFEQNEATLIL